MLWKRPILIGGLGLSATLWLLDTVHINVFDSSTLLSAIALGSGIWWWRTNRPAVNPQPVRVDPPSQSRLQQAMEAANRAIQNLESEATLAGDAVDLAAVEAAAADFRQQVGDLQQGLERSQLTVAILGEAKTGKTTLKQHLETQPNLQATLRFIEPDQPLADRVLSQADSCLWVTAGDLSESVLLELQQLVQAGLQTVLVLNKQDQYLPGDRELVLQRLQQRLQSLPMAVPVVAIAAAPNPLKVRQHQPDGTVKEWLEATPVTLEPLVETIHSQLQAAASTLVMATTLRQFQVLQQAIQRHLNQLRRQRAMPLVEQMQWVSAAAAFANPVPTLDLLATVAINAQLIVDLGRIYGFSFSLEEAKTAAGTLAQVVVKLGLVEVSTQALSLLLKSQMTTYVAGGILQGLSAAYLTRMAGQSLIEYFEAAALAQSPRTILSPDAIGQHLQRLIQPGQQGAFLRSLIQQGLEQLRPERQTAPVVAETGAIAS